MGQAAHLRFKAPPPLLKDNETGGERAGKRDGGQEEKKRRKGGGIDGVDAVMRSVAVATSGAGL